MSNSGSHKLQIIKHFATYQNLKVGGKYRIVKVLKEYDSEKEAQADTIKLLQGVITEEELLQSWTPNA